MQGWDWVVVFLVVLPWDPVPLLPEHPPTQKALLHSLKALNTRCEVAGPQESYGALGYELNYARMHHRALLNAPGLGDAEALPLFEDASWSATQNYTYEKWLINQMQLTSQGGSKYEAYADCLEVSRLLGAVWADAATASNLTNSWSVRRQALKRLRDKLSDPYKLPPPLPIWLFRDITP